MTRPALMRAVAVIAALGMEAPSSRADGGPRSPEDAERIRREKEAAAPDAIARAESKRKRRKNRNRGQNYGR